MQQFNNLGEVQNEVRMLLKDSTNTHEQTVFQLAKLAENTLPYPQNTPPEFYEYYEKDIFVMSVKVMHPMLLATSCLSMKKFLKRVVAI